MKRIETVIDLLNELPTLGEVYSTPAAIIMAHEGLEALFKQCPCLEIPDIVPTFDGEVFVEWFNQLLCFHADGKTFHATDIMTDSGLEDTTDLKELLRFFCCYST